MTAQPTHTPEPLRERSYAEDIRNGRVIYLTMRVNPFTDWWHGEFMGQPVTIREANLRPAGEALMTHLLRARENARALERRDIAARLSDLLEDAERALRDAQEGPR